jgi:DIS3-like exonuclease 1
MSNTEMMESIHDSERKGNAEKETTKKKKNKASSMYDVLERFRKLSIIQSTS